MSSLITLHALSASTPDGQPLFSDIDLAFGPERTGLIGRNGVGKSTLLRIIAGQLAPRSGAVSRSGSLGMLRQIVQPDPAETVADALGVRDALARIARVLAGDASDADLAEADWLLEGRVEEALAAVGMAELDVERPLHRLSGGQQTRVALAALLLQRPDMILLDEPTNNLDADGRAAVAEVLRRWKGGAIVVSHDRALLRAMDRIVELTTRGAAVYGGNWDIYAARKAEAEAAAEQQLASAQRRTKQVERAAQAALERKARRDATGRRFAASGSAPRILLGAQKQRAEQSGGRETLLADRLRAEAADTMAEAQVRVEIFRTLDFEIAASGIAPGRIVLAFDAVTGGPAPGVTPIRGLSFTITGPERVAVTGPNGAGKSTLLQLASGAIAPVAGTVRRGRVALLDQHMALLDPAATILDNYRRLNPQENDNDAHAALARFLFRNEAARKIVAMLSGGEMLRAGLACVLGNAQPPELLMLDEPTNHLDIASVEAVEAALCGYDGALLVVSHDADFLDAIGVGRVIELGSR